jgi:hypothetical protein
MYDYEEQALVFFADKVKIAKITNEGIFFSNGTAIQDIHEKECGEQVYADWNYLKEESLDRFENIEKITFIVVPNAGIRLNFYVDYHTKHSAFVPCYNSQNGYYSNELFLAVVTNRAYCLFDITKATFDDIY